MNDEKIKAYVASEPRGKFEPFEYEAGALGNEEVEIKVAYCGVCHSDLSMRDNDWGMTAYPFVGGHEAVGEIVAVGDGAKGLSVGDKVGLGWNAATCGHCGQCLSGYQINCPNLTATIVGRFGAFADRVRCNWDWAVKLPDALDLSKAGPLFCGGITVFNPFVQLDVERTDGRWQRVFSGWLYKESPSLNVVEHPVYDVWPKSCTMTFPAGAAQPAAPVASSNRSSARNSGAARRPSAPATPAREPAPSAPEPSAADSNDT